MSKINKVVVKGVSYDIEDAYARLKVNNLVKHVAWNDSSRLNDFTTAGVYEIKGERTMSREYDNLPIENSGSGHTISARLEVLDSSINDTTNSDDKCITQKLTLSNRVGGDGNVYIRTGRGRTYDSITWEKWGILQTNINVGQVGSLDEFVDNGIYSGVWTDGSSFAQTFVMVVINDYAVAGANKTIVQYKYAYDTLKGNGEPTYNTRSLHNGEWSDWEDVHDDDLNVLKEELLNAININKEDIANNSIAIGNEKYRAINAEKTLQKNIDNTNKIVGIEEKKKLSVYIGAVLEDGSTYSTNNSAYTNAFEGGDIAVTNDGYYIYDVRKVSADGVVEMVIVKNKRLRTEKGYTYQLNISKDNNAQFSENELEGIVGLYNYEGGDTSELEQKIESNTTDIQYLFEEAVKFDSFEVEELGDGIGINYSTFDANSGSIEIPFATEEKAGVMSAADKKALDAVVNNVDSLAVKKFYTLSAPKETDDSFKKIEKVFLNILGQKEPFLRLQVKKESGTIAQEFYAKDYGIIEGIPVHFVSFVYSEEEQIIWYQLYEKNVGYLQNFQIALKKGWNKLELEHTFETITQNTLNLFIGKNSGNDFYLYKTFVYNSITKAPYITELTTYELAERLGKVEPALKDVEIATMGVTFYDNEDVVFKGNGKTYNAKKYSTPVVVGDVFVVKLDSITKPADSPDNSYLRLQFYDGNDNQISQTFFYASDTPVNTEILIPDGCVKLTYIFGMSVSNPSILEGEYKWSGLTFKQISRNDVRFRNVEARVTELETLSNDWSGKVLSTYGDSVTALQGGDFSYPYNLTNTQRWGNRVADYFKMSKHYGRGIGGQKYAWGTNGGAITWIEKATGKMIDRSDAYTLESWDGETFTSNVSDADRTRIINGLADGSVISIRGCACSWLRIISMYPASIKDSIDAVFVMFHNDSVDGKEFSWVEGDTTDPEWAASEEYATYGGDYNISTLEGGIASTIMKLQAWLPNAVIILGTPINGQGTTGQLRPDANGLYKQVEHVKNVGLRFSIPVIDVYATCGINGLNRTDYITDNIHPYSVAGSKMVARAIIGGFKTILPKL